MAAKEKPAMHVVGDVGGRIAIMVDDMLGNLALVTYFKMNIIFCPASMKVPINFVFIFQMT